MKVNSIILCAAIAILFTACQNKKQPAEAPASSIASTIMFDTLRIDKHILLDSLDTNSPALKIDIELLVPTGTTPSVAEEINHCISYAAFGYEGITAPMAADSAVNSMSADYMELRNEYINEKAADPTSPWFNAYYILGSNACEGRGGSICYTVDYEIYSGGAHPNSIISCVNIDSGTGKEITLQDVFAPDTEEALTNKMVERLAQQNGVGSIEQLKEKGYFSFSDMYITNNFMLKKDSIIFLYNNYEIAPYYMGRSRIGFTYDELKDLLK